MITVRRNAERGHADHGWLDTHHTFSFADYYDPAQMGFGPLRVINEDRVAPGAGFPLHGHRDMEIISYVLEGALQHRDSLGNGSVIRAGEVQRMSAGSGVQHSEYNASRTEPVHFLQIWIQPNRKGVAPGYEQKRFDRDGKESRFRLIASPDGRDGSVTIHQDAFVYASLLQQGESATFHPQAGRNKVYVHVARGAVEVNREPLLAGDGARITGEESVVLATNAGAEVLLFSLGA